MGVPRTRASGSGHAARSGSSAGPEAAAPSPNAAELHRRGGPGEDRHLTRVGRQYAPGSAGQGLAPQGRHLAGLPRGERGVWGTAPRFSGHRDAPSMARQGHRVAASSTASSSGAVQGLREATRSVAMAGGLGACPQGFQAGPHPLNNLIQGNKVRQPDTTRLSGVLTMPKQPWEEGFNSGKTKVVDRCPYPAGSPEAWAWSSGRIEGQAVKDGYESTRQ